MSNHLYFEIQADEMERAAMFYSTLFGWKFQKAEEPTPVEYWRITTGGMAGGMLKRHSESPPPECGTNAFVCSFEVENFDHISDKITDLGGEIAMPKFAVPGVCWQGYFIDTEGNTFGIFQPDENAA
jgi:uncharacterized protein